MPEYDPALIKYLEETNGYLPFKAPDDPYLLKRTLSKESPPALVREVAEALDNVDGHPIIEQLSDFERGRIMNVLERQEEAIVLYGRALESCTDPALRGHILINLANSLDDPQRKERLFRAAIDVEGCDEAYTNLGLLFYQTGRLEEAESVLLTGIQKRVALSVAILGIVYAETKKGADRELAGEKLISLADAVGISMRDYAPFASLFNQTLFQRREEYVNIGEIMKSPVDTSEKITGVLDGRPI